MIFQCCKHRIINSIHVPMYWGGSSDLEYLKTCTNKKKNYLGYMESESEGVCPSRSVPARPSLRFLGSSLLCFITLISPFFPTQTECCQLFINLSTQ